MPKPTTPPPPGFEPDADALGPITPPPAGFEPEGATASTQGRLSPEEFRAQAMNHYSALAASPVPRGGGLLDMLIDTGRGMADTTRGLITGVGQSAAHTAYHLGKGVYTLARGAKSLPGGSMVPNVADIPGADQAFGSGTTPESTELPLMGPSTTTSEKIGKFAGDVGQYFIPGGAAEIRGAAKLPMLARAGVEGLSAAGVGAAQGSNPIATGVAGAAGPVISGAAAKLAPKVINTFIGPGISRTGANAGRAITSEGIVAPSLGDLSQLTDEAQKAASAKGPVSAAFGSLLEKTLRAKAAIGRDIGMTLLRSPAARQATIDAEPLFTGPIKQAISDMKVVGDSPQLESMLTHLTEAFKTRTANGVNSVTPSELWAIRDSLDKAIEKMGGFEREGAEVAVRNVAREVRKNFSQAIGDAVPEIRTVNQRYSDMAKAVDGVIDKIEGGQNKNATQVIHSMLYNPINYLFGIGAYHAGGNIPEWLGLLGARAALGSTPAVTTGAQGLRALGSPAGSAILSRGGAAAMGEAFSPHDQAGIAQVMRDHNMTYDQAVAALRTHGALP